MANPHKGETSIEIDGKTYTLALTLNAMCELEDLLGTPEKEVSFIEIVHAVTQRKRTSHMRALFWAALREHHPEVTLKQAGTLIQKMGGLIEFSKRLNGILETTNPDPDDLPDEGEESSGPRPMKAQAAGGTGDGSRSKLAVSA